MDDLEIKHEKDLVKISSKDPQLYEGISLAALTTYSLFWLHQWQLRRTIEAVAILNWRLFPDKFGMVGFSEFPDAFRTNRSLYSRKRGGYFPHFSTNAESIGTACSICVAIGEAEWMS